MFKDYDAKFTVWTLDPRGIDFGYRGRDYKSFSWAIRYARKFSTYAIVRRSDRVEIMVHKDAA